MIGSENKVMPQIKSNEEILRKFGRQIKYRNVFIIILNIISVTTILIYTDGIKFASISSIITAWVLLFLFRVFLVIITLGSVTILIAIVYPEIKCPNCKLKISNEKNRFCTNCKVQLHND